MPFKPWLLILLKDNYLEYRRDKAVLSGHLSPEMINTINVLDSKLATRGHIQPEQLNRNNKNIVTQIKLQKASQAFENRGKAVQALKSFLEASGKGATDSAAVELKDELEWLAGYTLAMGPQGTKWIPGPLKKLAKAMSKTIEDYDYAWTENKDLVRGTLACKTNKDLSIIATLVQATCVRANGMFLVKDDPQTSIRDGGKMKAGYSGWNFVVQFKDHRAFGAEIQANTFDMLYGKHSKEEFLTILQFSESEYSEMQLRLKFPGALGHALYDIQDTARSKATTEEGKLALDLCLDYNDACRGQFRKNSLTDLNQRIHDFESNLTSSVAKDLWHHCVEGCGWMGYPIKKT
jgi:hypothetical protein